MPAPEFLDPRLTERRNPMTTEIDTASVLEIIDMMNAEDRIVVDRVHDARQEIARCVDITVDCFRQGGRLLYVGAGTSGRLGVLDAAECPPTFGTPPEMVVGIIAGGAPALTRSQEGAEDRQDRGAASVADANVRSNDFVIGIAASGTTPFVRGALDAAKHRGARTGFLTCAQPPSDIADVCDVLLCILVGPEVLTGSTRLKAGTATKLVLNAITTASMVKLGKAYGNLMVDLRALSDKLVDRGERIVMETTGASRDVARRCIQEAQGSVKIAIVMARRGLSFDGAVRALESAGGFVRYAVGDPPDVSKAE